jgi:hypothetical protein
MPLCLANIDGTDAKCQRPLGHPRPCSELPTWVDLQPNGMDQDPQVSDKVKRSPTETAGKGGEWGFLQNKVNRASQVAIPLDVYLKYPQLTTHIYDNGFIVYATPEEHFLGVPAGLTLGRDYVVLYASQAQLDAAHAHSPRNDWKIFEVMNSRGEVASAWSAGSTWRGDYYVRVKNGQGWNYGTGTVKAIGIRQDEYCSKVDQRYIVGQMSYLAWTMPGTRARFNVTEIPQYIVDFLSANGMLDLRRMESAGMINSKGIAQCPFCREELSYQELVNQAPQQVGRVLSSSNATALHLMHIVPLKMGEFNHKPYNLAFGHAKCNHAQGEDSISQSIEFLFDRRLTDAMSNAGISAVLQAQIKAEILR